MLEGPASWDDLTLARRCADREEEAWQELLRRAGAVLEGVLSRVFRRAGIPDPAAEAAEAMGDLVAELLRSDAATLRAYRPEVPLRAYLALVARRQALRILRRRPRTLPLPEEPVAWAGDGPGLDVEKVRGAMGRLEPRQRLLLQLIYWEGLRHEEAGPVLGVQPSSVGPLLTRAREALRLVLQTDFPVRNHPGPGNPP